MRVSRIVLRSAPPVAVVANVVEAAIGVTVAARQSRNMAQTFISYEKVSFKIHR